MRSLIVMALFLISATVGESQWRKVADFKGFGGTQIDDEYITCVYFLDLPGPPRVGFVGTTSELWRTSDGGKVWAKVWGNGNYWTQCVNSIVFSDSLNGWFCFSAGEYDLYKTSDGGLTWEPVLIPLNTSLYYGPGAIYYCKYSRRLFLSMEDTSGMIVSSDMGKSWGASSKYGTGGYSFSSDSAGIVSAWFPKDSIGGFLYTQDGGLNWSRSNVGQIRFRQPLAVPGSPICFAAGRDSQTVVYRSDNYGATWQKIYDFGPFHDSNYNTINPAGTGDIEGSFDHLYIQSDLGMYVSTDQGRSWKHDGGPTYVTNFTNEFFYSAKGVTFAGMTYADGAVYGGGLWKEDLNNAAVESPLSHDPFIATLDTSTIAQGPYPNPTVHGAQSVSFLAHSGAAGSMITAQVFDVLGNRVGSAVTFMSDDQAWDRLVIPAPRSAGIYYIHVNAAGCFAVLKFSVN